MKFSSILLSTFMLLLFLSSASAQTAINVNDHVPSQLQNYVKQHFPENTIVKYKMEVSQRKVEYEIKLEEKTELDFNQDFQLIEGDSKLGLPLSVLPKKIVDYISENQPNVAVKEWETKSYGQKAELTNGVDLYFDKDGNFVRQK